ncbi:Undecaprenyl-diphosphatase BcrC [Pelotomaculum schinkii]|uniref:Undecaprenyl-diphosphatase BcrC n=2 Tax=Pelotomaculum schinkii TaxID=78350 RepID=A0A4Y7RBQ4_9FIRM|nr:Undecaprenyl-diphosphatase BcrC [Pelotomaculum schinkii]
MLESVFLTIKNLDIQWFYFVNQSLHNALFNVVMPFVSNVGDNGLLWLLFALLLYLFGPKTRRTSFLMLLALFISFVIGEEILKHIFQRPRPFLGLEGVNLLVGSPGSFSFPSGHAANAFASSLVVARKIPRLAWPALLMAVVMAFSRVYVGVHYPLDILGGVLLGVLCARFVLGLEASVYRPSRRTRRPPHIP